MLIPLLLACDPPDPTTPCSPSTFWTDHDRDGFGLDPIQACLAPEDAVETSGDCDDTRPTVHPGATPACDAVPDDDCDGTVDPFDADRDQDGVSACAGDCDDDAVGVVPGALEVCNAVDDDCNGAVDLDDPGVDPWTCDTCPEFEHGDVFPVKAAILNPCFLDPTATWFCSADPKHPDTPFNALRAHRVLYRTDLEPRPQLFLWLPPGLGDNFDIIGWAASAGFRVIALGYPNESPVTPCPFDDSECLLAMRREIVYGTDESDLVACARADSIEGRLTVLLETLIAGDPDGHWDEFLDPSGEVRWDRIVVSAWSDANVFASTLAHDQPLHGAFYISGPPDEGLPAGPAYLAEPFATPPCASYAINHARESFAEGNEACWDVMGLQGPTALVDDGSPPYGSVHRLTTMSYDFDDPECNAHSAVARDECIDESVLFEPYRFLFCALGNRDRTVCP